MQPSAITKAALWPVGAVFAVVTLSVSLPHSLEPASIEQTHSTKAASVITPMHIAEQAPHLPAAPTALPATITAEPLLPIVQHDGISPRHQQLADTVLRRLPPDCRDNLRNFQVLYANASNRGLGGKTSMIIDGTSPDNEFIGLIVHECAHVIHGNMLGNPRSGHSTFRDGRDVFGIDSPAVSFFRISWLSAKQKSAMTTEQDFISGYAKTDAFEDFAETFTMYVLQRPALELRAIQHPAINEKLQWMERTFPLPTNLLGTPLYTWNGTIPWDTTKLPYVWEPVIFNTLL